MIKKGKAPDNEKICAEMIKYGGETLLLSADIEPTARPQELSIEAFTQLANKMRQQNHFAHI